LKEAFDKRITWEPMDARRLQSAGELPALKIGGLKLREVVAVHRDDPFRMRHITVPEDHGLERKGQGERRLEALEEVVETPLYWGTPRDQVRILVALNAAAGTDKRSDEGFGREFLKEEWGPIVYEDVNQWIYPKPPCTNRTTYDPNAPVPEWFDESTRWFCPEPVEEQTGGGDTKEPTPAPTVDTKAPEFVNASFEREIKYLRSARKRLRESLTSDGRTYVDTFYGLRKPPCEGINDLEEFEGRCIDDVGVAVSIYEDPTHKVILFHGGWYLDVNYTRWALKNQIMDKMEGQVILQWTISARQLLTPEMKKRRGEDRDAMATTCAFKETEYFPFPHMKDVADEMDLEEDFLAEEGMWLLVMGMVRKVLPEGRNKKLEKQKTLMLSGAEQGGTWAVLSSLWLNKVEAEEYETFVFAPAGFQCLAYSMYGSYMDSWVEQRFIHVYMHVFDPLGGLGMVSGNVCLYGMRNFTKAHPVRNYCEKIIGFTGPQLLYEGMDAVEPTTPPPANPTEVAEEGDPFNDPTRWPRYLKNNDLGREYFNTCKYFTHSAWYAAILMLDADTLFLNGGTDGGCQYVEGVQRGDRFDSCPAVSLAERDCKIEFVGRKPLPYVMMGSIMAATGVFITSCMIFIFVMIHAVKNDNWVYGKDYKRYARQGCIDWTCLFPCLYKDKKVQFSLDREQDARMRAKRINLERFEVQAVAEIEGNKQKRKDEGGEEHLLTLLKQQVEARRKESTTFHCPWDGVKPMDVYVLIDRAGPCRETGWYGKSDPLCVVDVPMMERCRIVTATCPTTLWPVWNHQEQLVDYSPGLELEVAVYDEDPGKRPEEMDLIGKVDIPAVMFYPWGMDMSTFHLHGLDREPLECEVKLKIACVEKGSELPMPVREMDVAYMVRTKGKAVVEEKSYYELEKEKKRKEKQREKRQEQIAKGRAIVGKAME